ncbi:MAG: alpha/beta hydrolase fold [Tardiphaga sp.]|uniref:alpha/beta hydrolase n=1 Tax=Tardiphaga sp. TaxID=1926292 RepID=UPI00263043EF|nr:alpha/beta hydrolase [Tardiphaga sp.]MDB5502914.1 alpha/beta hydrolase fold [Tardiphaga sp.]
MSQRPAKSLQSISVPYQPPRLARANGIEICYDIFGADDAEPMMMIMGLGAQMIHWDDDFCRELASRGFRVIRFDNRDIGLSTKMAGGKPFSLFELAKLRFLGTPVEAPYKLGDMAADAIGLLDALDIASAHMVGASMGGMIAQELTIEHPDRVRSLVSIMSTTGNPRLPQPGRTVAAKLLQPQPTTYDAFVARFKQTWLFLRVGSFPEDEARDADRAERTFARGLHPAGVGRQLRAILASGSRKERLAAVTAPTLVIHGKVDPLVHPAGGRDTAASIPGAELLMIDGMGHALPISLWSRVIDAIAEHAKGATTAPMVQRRVG